jgi:hypothetical protein
VTADLTAFLLARIEADEATAGDVHDEGDYCGMFNENVGGCTCSYPARVLAECEAKRAIVARAKWIATSIEPLDDHRSDFAEDVLGMLAMAYRDHPDFNEDWTPDAWPWRP